MGIRRRSVLSNCCARSHGRMSVVLLAAIAATMPISFARADYEAPDPAYAAPSAYYALAAGLTGNALHLQLHTIISTGFNQLTYDDARYALADTDTDPNNPTHILTIYDRSSLPSTWDAGDTWNREHMWPASRINGKTSGPTADLFELRPANSKINSSRGNRPYGGGPAASGSAYNGSTYYFPGDADKGDVARAMFYMATRYYTGSATLSPTNLQLINGYNIGSLPDYQMGDLASLLAWNYQDGVDNFERRRNQMIYKNTIDPEYSQNNRNPFVDHPEYVWAVFGTGANTSQLSIATPGANGASSTTVDLGRVITGAAFTSTSVLFTKTGDTPTTFDLTSTDNAITPITSSGYISLGTGQGIDYNTQTRKISVGLNASMSTAGLKSGNLTLHNTDLTTAGAGQGSADADDTIHVTGTVLAHSNASFDPIVDSNALTLDFGALPQNSAAAAQSFSISNLLAVAGYTAGLDFTAFSQVGNTDIFSLNLVPFSNEAAGSSDAFLASIDTDSLGAFSATYTLVTVDQSLPGALAGAPLTLTVVGTITAVPEPATVACLLLGVPLLLLRRRH